MKVVRESTQLVLYLSVGMLFLPVALRAMNNCIKENFIIALDAGHPKLRSGAISARRVPENIMEGKIRINFKWQ